WSVNGVKTYIATMVTSVMPQLLPTFLSTAVYPNTAAASLTVAKVTGVIRDRPSTYAATVEYSRSTSAAVATNGLRFGLRLGLCQVTWRWRTPCSTRRDESVSISSTVAISGLKTRREISHVRAATPAARSQRN